jgi:hypothetical protein
MRDRRGNAFGLKTAAYGLTALCPIVNTNHNDQSAAALVRCHLRDVPLDAQSPMAKVPNTYLCRLFVLDDVPYQGHPAQLDHLKSKYLVFVAEIHGELEPYLRGMWNHAEAFVRATWKHCVAFAGHVEDATSFIRYVKKCQVETTFYFNGSTDQVLAEQLKALYLKQELTAFAFANQGKKPADLQRAFNDFVARVAPTDLSGPTWAPGASSHEVPLDDRRPRSPARLP